MQHREHLSEHIKASWTPTVHADGRKHLLSPPGSLSRLAEAVAPEGSLAQFDDHYLCGEKPLVEAEVLKLKLALAAVSWMAPRSLRNSMESWRASGLLDIADERMIFLNSPTPEDFAIAAEFDFDVYTTDEHDGNISAWRGGSVVPVKSHLTELCLPCSSSPAAVAGPSIAYLVGNSTADVILFLEKDFVVSSTREVMLREMWNGMQHLSKGVEVYR